MGIREATTKTVKVRAQRPFPRTVRKGSEPSSSDSAEPRRGLPLPGAGSHWTTAAQGTGWAGRAKKEGERGQLWAPRRRGAATGWWFWSQGPGDGLGRPRGRRVSSASPLDPDWRPAGRGGGWGGPAARGGGSRPRSALIG